MLDLQGTWHGQPAHRPQGFLLRQHDNVPRLRRHRRDTMSDTDMAPRTGSHRPVQGRRRAHRPTSLEGLPTAEDLASAPHKGDDADRFSLYTPEQVEAETKDVKLCITFGQSANDPAAVIKIRDQAEMIIAGMRAIIEKTRQHDIGSIRQRIESRAEAASLGRALSRFNGRTPHGDWKPKSAKS